MAAAAALALRLAGVATNTLIEGEEARVLALISLFILRDLSENVFTAAADCGEVLAHT